MKKTNLSWVGALLVFALLLWCTAATPGTIADPASYAPAVYSSMLSLLPPVVAIVLALNTKEVYTSLLVGIATGALLFANGNLELAVTTLFFNEDGGMITKLRAAAIATEAGCEMVITNGQSPEILYDVAAGRRVGTRFTVKKD